MEKSYLRSQSSADKRCVLVLHPESADDLLAYSIKAVESSSTSWVGLRMKKVSSWQWVSKSIIVISEIYEQRVMSNVFVLALNKNRLTGS